MGYHGAIGVSIGRNGSTILIYNERRLQLQLLVLGALVSFRPRVRFLSSKKMIVFFF